MYIYLNKYEGGKFKQSDLWETQKYTDMYTLIKLISENGECIDKTQPYSDLEQYWRPTKNLDFIRKEINKLPNKETFSELLDLLENNSDLYVSYE